MGNIQQNLKICSTVLRYLSTTTKHTKRFPVSQSHLLIVEESVKPSIFVQRLRWVVKATHGKLVTQYVFSPRVSDREVVRAAGVFRLLRQEKLQAEWRHLVLLRLTGWTVCWPELRRKMEHGFSITGDTKVDQAVRQWLQYDKVSWQLASEVSYVLGLSCALELADYK